MYSFFCLQYATRDISLDMYILNIIQRDAMERERKREWHFAHAYYQCIMNQHWSANWPIKMSFEDMLRRQRMRSKREREREKEKIEMFAFLREHLLCIRSIVWMTTTERSEWPTGHLNHSSVFLLIGRKKIGRSLNSPSNHTCLPSVYSWVKEKRRHSHGRHGAVYLHLYMQRREEKAKTKRKRKIVENIADLSRPSSSTSSSFFLVIRLLFLSLCVHVLIILFLVDANHFSFYCVSSAEIETVITDYWKSNWFFS